MKQARLIIILFALLVLGFLAFAIFRNREPRYQGRTLTQWIERGASAYHQFWEQHTNSNDWPLLTSDPAFKNASEAVQQMAPQATPLLLKWLRTQDSPVKRKLGAWFENHPRLNVHIDLDRKSRLAISGFGLLGKRASPAWPALIYLTRQSDPSIRVIALKCLFNASPEKDQFVPVLRQFIQEPDVETRLLAACMFHYRFPKEAEAAGVYKMFPSVKDYPTEQGFTNQPPIIIE